MGTYASNLLPNATGLDLGSTSQRWDAFLKDVDASGNLTVSGTSTLGTLASLAVAGNATIGGTLAVTGATTLGNVTVKSINSIAYADQFAGADLGVRINAADAFLGSTPGEIWVNRNAGTAITTAVNLSAQHCLRFVEGGTYTLGGIITLAAGSSIVGSPLSGSIGTNSGFTTIIQQAASANLGNLLIMSGSGSAARDICFDGNKGANINTVGILVSGTRCDLQNVVSQSNPSHGVIITGGVVNLFKTISYLNGGDGFFVSGASAGDVTAVQTQAQGNSMHGWEFNNAPSPRLCSGDIGDNQLDGIKAYGTAAVGSNNGVLVGNNIGQNHQNDVNLIGTDGGGGSLGCYGWVITGNAFIGAGAKAANNTYDNIKLTDCSYLMIANNALASPGDASNRTKYAIENTETAGGVSNNIHIGDNTYIGTYGTGTVINSSTNPLLSTIGGKISSYNTIATVGNGVPAEYGQANSTGLVGAVGATTLFTPSATGWYRISAVLKITTVGTSPVAGPITITYTDGDGSVAQSHVMTLKSVTGTIVTTTVNNSTTTGTVNGNMDVYALAGVPIQYAIAASGTFGAGVYSAHLRLEAL